MHTPADFKAKLPSISNLVGGALGSKAQAEEPKLSLRKMLSSTQVGRREAKHDLALRQQMLPARFTRCGQKQVSAEVVV